MQVLGSPRGFLTDISCGALLRELQQIWDEIGESEADRDRMLLELEKECLEVYRRKVDEASNTKARLHHTVAAKEVELAALVAAMGELNIQPQADKRITSLKEQLASVTPLLEDLRVKKEERIKQFADVRAQIEKINGEISGYCHSTEAVINQINVDEHDLSLRKLNEYQTHLRSLQKEKSDRLHKVLEYVNEVHGLCGVLGLDFGKTVNEVHPSLQEMGPGNSTNISNNTLDGLAQTILKLKLEKKDRVQKLKDIVASLFELWSLMDSPEEETSRFGRITRILRSSEEEISDAGVLSLELIEQAAAEVERLTKLKASRMKELVLKKRLELEEMCRMAHIEPDTSTASEKSNALIDSGIVDPSELLASIEAQMVKVKEESMSRKEIMDRVDKWLAACGEEKWLEKYSQVPPAQIACVLESMMEILTSNVGLRLASLDHLHVDEVLSIELLVRHGVARDGTEYFSFIIPTNDENRYSAGRGGHINLKRAERARVTVNKIPGMVDNLVKKAFVWEEERNMHFLYDGVRLVMILEKYKLSRQQKEEEKKRFRDQKKLQDMLLTEREAIYGSKPSPKRSNSLKKPNGIRVNGNGSMTPTPRRLSVGSATPELLTPRSHSGHQNGYFKQMRRLSTAPLNFVALPKEDTISFASLCGSEPGSPPQC